MATTSIYSLNIGLGRPDNKSSPKAVLLDRAPSARVRKFTHFGAFNSLRSHDEIEVNFPVKWIFYLLEWWFERRPLLLRMFFASAATFGDGLETFNSSLEGDSLPFCVVGSGIEGTIQKWVFCALWIVLWRCLMGHGAKVSKDTQKIVIFVIFTNSEGGPVGPGPEIWTYILFWPISRCSIQKSKKKNAGSREVRCP